MKKVRTVVLTVFCFGGIGTTHAAGDVELGRVRAEACKVCHGVDGNSPNAVYPSLAGRSEGYLVKQLMDFKEGRRDDPIMKGISLTLNEEAMHNVAAYYRSMIPRQGATSADPELLRIGRKIYRGGNARTGVSACMSCHGPAGHGIPPRFPRLSGQHGAYIQKQLLAFKNEARANDQKIMTSIAFRMSLKEIKAVSEYISGLQ